MDDKLKAAGLGILAAIGATTLLKPIAGYIKEAIPDMEKILSPDMIKHIPLLTQGNEDEDEKQEQPKQETHGPSNLSGEKQEQKTECRDGEHDFK